MKKQNYRMNTTTTRNMEFQACKLETYTDEKGAERRKVVGTMSLIDYSLASAYKLVNSTCGNNIIVLPMVDRMDGESAYRMADYVVRQVEKWELRDIRKTSDGEDSIAVMNPFTRQPADKEDYREDAILGIYEAFNAGYSNMYDIKTIAFRYVRRKQQQQVRNSEREIHPDYVADHLIEKAIIATDTRLNRFVADCIDSAKLSTSQEEVLMARFYNQMSIVDIADERGTSRNAVYKQLYKALYHVLEEMYNRAIQESLDAGYDGVINLLTQNGFTLDDCRTALVNYRRLGGL